MRCVFIKKTDGKYKIDLQIGEENWVECSMVCYPKINSKIIKKDIEKEIINAVEIVKDFRLSLSKRKDVDEK
ncbi:MAG: hypothetical protein KJ674_05365 [Nanoarchaeota archaeon]|nr:hypothetical protein [Nanoarchaeota archaeon]